MRGGSRSRHCHRGRWRVRARVERFAEASVLLLLRDRPGAHGYELLEELAAQFPGPQPDMGNLYRLLRSLEEESFVRSEWDADAPGPARRRYWLSPEGEQLLDAWAAGLRRARTRIDDFLRTHGKGGDDVPGT
jgi:PadR family transcriptional regulator, regulatory protein PadR